MPEFIVRARAAPVSPKVFRASVGQGRGIEYLADILKAGLLLSQGHRIDSTVHLVLEKSADYSRVVTVDGSVLGTLAGLQEVHLLDAIAEALEYSAGANKNERVVDARGLAVSTTSFEHWVKFKAEEKSAFMLRPDGDDIRSIELPDDAVFILSDHIPMPKKTFKSMVRQGVKPVSVGSYMLHTSHCIAVILNEMDRR